MTVEPLRDAPPAAERDWQKDYELLRDRVSATCDILHGRIQGARHAAHAADSIHVALIYKSEEAALREALDLLRARLR